MSSKRGPLLGRREKNQVAMLRKPVQTKGKDTMKPSSKHSVCLKSPKSLQSQSKPVFNDNRFEKSNKNIDSHGRYDYEQECMNPEKEPAHFSSQQELSFFSDPATFLAESLEKSIQERIEKDIAEFYSNPPPLLEHLKGCDPVEREAELCCLSEDTSVDAEGSVRIFLVFSSQKNVALHQWSFDY